MGQFASRKFLTTLLTTLGILLAEVCGVKLQTEVLAGVAGMVSAYLLSQGWVDAKAAQQVAPTAPLSGAANVAQFRESCESPSLDSLMRPKPSAPVAGPELALTDKTVEGDAAVLSMAVRLEDSSTANSALLSMPVRLEDSSTVSRAAAANPLETLIGNFARELMAQAQPAAKGAANA